MPFFVQTHLWRLQLKATSILYGCFLRMAPTTTQQAQSSRKHLWRVQQKTTSPITKLLLRYEASTSGGLRE